MSGIAGICHLDGRRADRASLQQMAAAIAHRGPDGTGYWIDGTVGFAHLMLRTTSESIGESQPLCFGPASLCITLDGRVDNRRELRASFLGRGLALRDDTDAELVLRAYECWEEDCARHILGDFAFAIWDGRNRKLFCARDLVGLRPLYYHYDGRALRFASEIGSLLATPGFQRKLNPGMLAEYLCDAHASVDETLYENILRLPPGHRLVLKDASLRISRCMHIDPFASVRYASDRDYAEHFLGIFEDSVRCRLRGQAPAALFLSGGLDSSAIFAMSARLAEEAAAPVGRLAAYHLAFDRPEANERNFVDDLAGMRGGTIQIVNGDAAAAELHAGRPQHPDLPAEEMISPWPALYSTARRTGSRVVLWGYGADELLTGNPAHCADLVRRLQFRKLIRQVRSNIAVHRHWDSKVGLREIAKWCLLPLIPRALKDGLKRGAGMGVPKWFTPGFAKASAFRERLAQRHDQPAFPTRVQQHLYESLVGGYRISTYEILNRHDAICGMEGRLPFFDRRLVEFALAIPEGQRWLGDQTKFVLREAMRGLLPESIRQRRTKGTYTHLVKDSISRQCIGGTFPSLRLAADGYVNPDAVQEMYERYRQGDESTISSLWSVLAVERWMYTA